MPQGKEDGVGNIGERKQVTTVRVDSKRGGEVGVDNRAEEGKQVTTAWVDSKRGGEGSVNSRADVGKRQTTVAAATKGTIAMSAGKTTLNSLIIRVTFEEIVLSGLGTLMETLSVIAILNELGQLAGTCL